MPNKAYKPTSASRRNYSVADYRHILTARKPHKPLTKKMASHGGRNSQGRITMRHQGGGNKKTYRSVDFTYDKKNVPGRVETIEYDPYRTAFIALVVYRDGERRYILAPDGLTVGAQVITSEDAPLTPGNRLPLKKIPVGAFVHNIEFFPGGSSRIGRSAGTSIQILANEEGYTNLKMPSGEVRRVMWNAAASIGKVSNPEHNLIIGGKAGRSRWLGIRPTVRGKAMNPVDHPYGGGEGSQPRGTKRPKNIWGKVTGGKKTRNKKKRSQKLIVKRRK